MKEVMIGCDREKEGCVDAAQALSFGGSFQEPLALEMPAGGVI